MHSSTDNFRCSHYHTLYGSCVVKNSSRALKSASVHMNCYQLFWMPCCGMYHFDDNSVWLEHIKCKLNSSVPPQSPRVLVEQAVQILCDWKNPGQWWKDYTEIHQVIAMLPAIVMLIPIWNHKNLKRLFARPHTHSHLCRHKTSW